MRHAGKSIRGSRGQHLQNEREKERKRGEKERRRAREKERKRGREGVTERERREREKEKREREKEKEGEKVLWTTPCVSPTFFDRRLTASLACWECTEGLTDALRKVQRWRENVFQLPPRHHKSREISLFTATSKA